jgi:hypothetical protein
MGCRASFSVLPGVKFPASLYTHSVPVNRTTIHFFVYEYLPHEGWRFADPDLARNVSTASLLRGSTSPPSRMIKFRPTNGWRCWNNRGSDPHQASMR